MVYSSVFVVQSVGGVGGGGSSGSGGDNIIWFTYKFNEIKKAGLNKLRKHIHKQMHTNLE